MGSPERLTEAAGRHCDTQSAADWALRQTSVRLYSVPVVREPELTSESNLWIGSNTSNLSISSVKNKAEGISESFQYAIFTR